MVEPWSLDLFKWVPEALIAAVGWYVRQAAISARSAASSADAFSKELAGFRTELVQVELRFEKKVDEQLGNVYRRLERLAVKTESRVSAIEGRCGSEHPTRGLDYNRTRQSFAEDSDIMGGVRK